MRSTNAQNVNYSDELERIFSLSINYNEKNYERCEMTHYFDPKKLAVIENKEILTSSKTQQYLYIFIRNKILLTENNGRQFVRVQILWFVMNVAYKRICSVYKAEN